MSNLKIILFKSKTLKDGTHPIVLRLYYDKESYISLGYSCLAKQWNARSGRFNKKMENHEMKNAVLRQQEAKADKIIQELVLQNKPFSFYEFKKRFKGTQERITVVEFVEKRMQELEAEGAIGNRNKYKQLRNRLRNFKGRHFIFTDVDYTFLKEFEHHILSAGVKKSTASFYLRTLRAILNEAIRRGYMHKDAYPFGTQFNAHGFGLGHLKSEPNPKPLALDELERFKAFPVKDYPHLQVTFDLFMFTLKARGINFIDVCELKRENIVGSRLNYIRQKTGKLYSINLTPELRAIINKYMGETYLFPIMDTAPVAVSARYHFGRKALKIYNDQLKEIGSILQIDMRISSYTARYSYTNVLVQNNVPVPILHRHWDIHLLKPRRVILRNLRIVRWIRRMRWYKAILVN